MIRLLPSRARAIVASLCIFCKFCISAQAGETIVPIDIAQVEVSYPIMLLECDDFLEEPLRLG